VLANVKKAGTLPVMATEQTAQEEIVQRLMELFARTLDHQGTCLETLELTYAQAKLMWRLETGDTPSLKELAKRCGVDPSNLAGVGCQRPDDQDPAAPAPLLHALALPVTIGRLCWCVPSVLR
jgi:hypothetical protein